ncbi:MAG: class E sortase [Candidatus Daviesbacteria bacterium]
MFWKRILPFTFLGIGVFILIQILMPLISFKVWEISLNNQNLSLASPDPDSQTVLGISIENRDNFPAIISTNKRATPAFYSQFNLSIPSIKLDDAQVLVDSNNFEQNLAHLSGSALPGEKGNVFITGHSSLPQLFRPGNYKAIFANLPNIKKGDEIIVEAGGQKFTYLVQGMKIIDPKQTSVINSPSQEGRYLTLMTCVPPGLYLKRLIVLGILK